MLSVFHLSLRPWLRRRGKRVGAVLHDLRDLIAEARPDVFQPLPTAVVFGGIVQQCPDSLVLVAAIVEHDRRDAHEVSQVRDGRPLLRLRPMHLVRVADGLVEPLRQVGHSASLEHYCAVQATVGVFLSCFTGW